MDPGVLHLPSVETAESLAPLWTESAFNRSAVVVAVVLMLLCLRGFFFILPMLHGCLVRRRGNLELEHSVSISRVRNRCAFCLFPSFVLIADRYCLVSPRGLAFTAGILVAYLLLRAGLSALFFVFNRGRTDCETRNAARRCLYNFFCLFMIPFTATLGLMVLAGAEDASVRTVMVVELAIVWAFALLRENHFLGNYCSRVATFLYLCSSELLPAALAIACGQAL